ncbi:MAG: Rab family GTPase [Promethearchaeota archaeon]
MSNLNENQTNTIKNLFQNFLESLPEIKGILIADLQAHSLISLCTTVDEHKSSLKQISESLTPVLERIGREMFSSGYSHMSSFDTNQFRLIFIRISEQLLLCIAIDVEASVESFSPYAYITAEKVKSILGGQDVDLSIPLIKSMTPEEEERRFQDLLFELLSTSKAEFIFKLVVLGDPNVGKTSLIYRYSEKKFKKDFLPTLGVSITKSTVSIFDKIKVHFNIWDFGGHEIFKRVRQSYYTGANAALLVFDLTDKTTFDNIKRWLEEKQRLSGDIPTVLIGNKSDLAESRQVGKEEIIEFANKNGLSYVETSALTGANVNDAFSLLAYKIIDVESKKAEKRELNALKKEIEDVYASKNEVLNFGVIQNNPIYAPVMQIFKELDPSMKINTHEYFTMYELTMGLKLYSIIIKNPEVFPMQLDVLKEMNGVIGIIDTRKYDDPDNKEIDKCTRFIRLLFNNVPDNFAGTIGIICKAENYSDYLHRFDISDILKNNPGVTVLWYCVESDGNIILDIANNLKMFFTSYSLA